MTENLKKLILCLLLYIIKIKKIKPNPNVDITKYLSGKKKFIKIENIIKINTP